MSEDIIMVYSSCLFCQTSDPKPKYIHVSENGISEFLAFFANSKDLNDQ